MLLLADAPTGEQGADELQVACQQDVVRLLQLGVAGWNKVAQPADLVLQHLLHIQL